MGEECIDQDGPRKEWIRLMNQAIREKYFDRGLRPLLAQDYYFVGIMGGCLYLKRRAFCSKLFL